MAYKALYRTYRPTTFEEVAGQQHIVKTIRNAVLSNKIAHAYLFAGPRGTGKTTMARLLAKSLNCSHGIGCQCNECENCRAINEGAHPDVIEIDAASNNGVDQVREIVDKVKYGTILGRYKVYIIDEVHMMSDSALNALLKTLEEPPSHVIFILATTEPHKILPTILSRCQRYDFSKVSDADIKARLQLVLDNEEIEYGDAALDLIVSLADGGMRDALSILDQVLAFSNDRLNEEDILDIFSLESTEEKLSLINSIIDCDIPDVLQRIRTYVDKGSDLRRLTSDILDILKDLLIFSNIRDPKFLSKIDEEDASFLVSKLKIKQINEMIDILMNTLKDFKSVTSINPLFEVNILKMASLFTPQEEPQPQRVEEKKKEIKISTAEEESEELSEDEELIKYFRDPQSSPKKETVVEPQKEVKHEQASLFDEPVEEKPNIVLSKDLILPKGLSGEETFMVDDDLMIKFMVSAKKEIKNNLLSNWNALKKYFSNPDLGAAAALLADAHPLVASNKILIVECALTNSVNKINDKKMQQALQNTINSAFGNRMFVYAVTRSDSVRLQKKYTDLYSVGKLPKAKDIVIEFEGENAI